MSVYLAHRADFEQVLAGYHPSEAGIALIRDHPLVILLGVSGAGRNTIINNLVNSGKYHFIISDTTRPPKLRDGHMEQDGVNYFFRSEDDMLADLRSGKFLEAELIHDQQVSGISIRELEKATTSGKIPINEVDVGGTYAIRAAKPDTLFFFMIPPNFKEWMYRLQGREVMSSEELSNRLHTAETVLEQGLAGDFHFVVNESSHATAEMIDNVVQSGVTAFDDSDARQVAAEVLAELRAHSGTH